MMNPKFSIITVVFNDVNHIEGTINSVLSQSYKDFEYIIVDGGSTDGTASIILKYQDNISFFITEKDEGIYDAMNKGISYCRGRWVCFMNSGDFLYNDSVLHDIAFSCNLEDDVIYGDTNAVFDFGAFVVKAKEPEYLKRDMPFCHQSSFTKSDLLRKYLFDLSFKYVADYNFFYNLYYKGYKFKRLDITVATFDAKDGVSSVNKNKVFKELLMVQSSHYNIINIIRIYYRMLKYSTANLIGQIFPSIIKKWRENRMS